jgi:hypothetical protein
MQVRYSSKTWQVWPSWWAIHHEGNLCDFTTSELCCSHQCQCWLHQCNLYFELNLCKYCRAQLPNLPEICLLVAKVKDADRSWMCARFEVLTVVLLSFQVFWDMMLCCWVSVWVVPHSLKDSRTAFRSHSRNRASHHRRYESSAL